MAKRLEAFAEDREPWERQPGETPTQFDRFRAFLDAGPGRKVITTADELGVQRATLHQLSALLRWRERAELYDAEQARIRRARQAADAERFREVEARIAVQMMRQVTRGIEVMAEGEPLPPEQVPRWVEAASKVGRLAYGEPSDMLSLTSPADGGVRLLQARADASIAEMTPEQRHRLAEDLAELVRQQTAAARDADPTAPAGGPGV